MCSCVVRYLFDSILALLNTWTPLVYSEQIYLVKWSSPSAPLFGQVHLWPSDRKKKKKGFLFFFFFSVKTKYGKMIRCKKNSCVRPLLYFTNLWGRKWIKNVSGVCMCERKKCVWERKSVCLLSFKICLTWFKMLTGEKILSFCVN